MENSAALKSFIKYSSLSICAMLALSCYILVDTFFIAQCLGERGLAALNIAIPVYNVMHGAGLMVGMGGAAKFSIYKGQKEHKKADLMFTNTLYIAAALSVFFMLCGALGSEKITALLGADKEIFEMTNIYIKVLLVCSPAFLMNNVLLCFTRNDGKPQLAMAATASGSFLNIILDYVFMFIFKMGMFGAVAATVFSPVMGIALTSRHFLSKNKGFHIVRSKIDPKFAKNNVLLGFPSFLEQMSSGIVIVVFNFIILAIAGNTGVAAYGVVANISLVVSAVFTGIAQGIQPLSSTAYGKNNIAEAEKYLKYAIILMTALAAAVYAFIFIFAEEIALVFNSEKNALLQGMAVEGLRLYFVSTVFMGFNIIISMYFISVEKVAPAHTISLLRGFAVIIPMAFVLSSVWKMNGVWISFPASEIVVFLVSAALYRKCRK